jgi:hypothetical protein
LYNCKPGLDSTFAVDLTLPVVGAFSLRWRWYKTCKSGASTHIELGFISASGARQKFGTGDVVIPATLAVTEVYLDVLRPAVVQEYGAPAATSSDTSVVTVTTRGSSGKGVTSLRDPATISVLYSCLMNGKATIQLSVPVPPWDDMQTSFVKDCGGGAASVSVGTSYDSRDVVSAGVTTNEYIASVSEATDGSVKASPAVPVNMRESSFIVQHTGDMDEDAVHFSNAVVTVGDNTIMRVSVRGFLSGANKFSQEGGMLYPGDSRKLVVHFICLRKGRSWVVISLPLMRYKPIEFGFAKDCASPVIHRESSIFNVHGIMNVLLILLVLFGVGMCFFIRAGRLQLGRENGAPKYQMVLQEETRIGVR